MFDWLLNELWKYTFSNLGSWHEHIAEVTPFSIEEDIDYSKKGCTYINHEKHEDLKLLYSKTDNYIKIIINKIFEIGTKDLYSSISNKSLETKKFVYEIEQILAQNGIELPICDNLEKYDIEQNDGWGNEFRKSEII
ncbi:MAG: hypothetical protein CFE22_04990 [Cytophagaceae bacterium BCCC1]|nr:MAG: hypothetical protein CFE22_04990 [Cytophagaceae bacterium BCCC1]